MRGPRLSSHLVLERRESPHLGNLPIRQVTGGGSQSWASDNSVATMGPCFQGTKLFVFVILLFLLWLPHLGTEA